MKQANAAYNCPGTEVVFTCVVDSSTLSWNIDFLRSSDIDRVAYLSSDPVGLIQRASSRGHLYQFNLTSKTPFTSTMTTIASADFSGATLSCQDRIATESVHTDTLVVEILPGIIIVLSTAGVLYFSIAAKIARKWYINNCYGILVDTIATACFASNGILHVSSWPLL